MTTSPKAAYKTWAEITAAPGTEQSAMIKQTYEAVAKLGDAERTARLHEMEEALCRLSDDLVRGFTRSRIAALLAMEPAAALAATAPYQALLDKLSGAVAMRHVTIIQNMAREYTTEDQTKLWALFPRALALKADGLVTPKSATPAAAPKKSGWGPFKK